MRKLCILFLIPFSLSNNQNEQYDSRLVLGHQKELMAHLERWCPEQLTFLGEAVDTCFCNLMEGKFPTSSILWTFLQDSSC